MRDTDAANREKFRGCEHFSEWIMPGDRQYKLSLIESLEVPHTEN